MLNAWSFNSNEIEYFFCFEVLACSFNLTSNTDRMKVCDETVEPCFQEEHEAFSLSSIVQKNIDVLRNGITNSTRTARSHYCQYRVSFALIYMRALVPFTIAHIDKVAFVLQIEYMHYFGCTSAVVNIKGRFPELYCLRVFFSLAWRFSAPFDFSNAQTAICQCAQQWVHQESGCICLWCDNLDISLTKMSPARRLTTMMCMLQEGIRSEDGKGSNQSRYNAGVSMGLTRKYITSIQ